MSKLLLTAETPASPRGWTLEYLRLKLFVSILILVTSLGQLRQRNLPLSPKVSVTRTTIPSREKGRKIRVNVYRPVDAKEGKLPVHLNWHGSGYVLPHFGTDEAFCSYVCERLNVVIIDADYRKAPDNPWPAAPQDAEDALTWVLSQSATFDLSKITLGGFSAGGNLALTAACRALARGLSVSSGAQIRALVPVYPPATLTRGSFTPALSPQPPFEAGLVLPPQITRIFNDSYVPAGADPQDATLTSSYSVQHFPPIVRFVTGDADSLITKEAILIDRLKREGHPDVQLHVIEKSAHSFDKVHPPANDKDPLYLRQLERRNRAYDIVIDAIRKSHKLP